MATDSHRKHHRSPSDNESPDSPKRHKHHRHRRHHRRHRSNHHDHEKNGEITTPENKHKEEDEEVIVTKKPVLVDYDDMEEGEIIEEDDDGGGGNLAVEGELKDVKKAGGDSDVESGEFKAGDGPTRDFDDSYMSIDAGTSKKSPGSDQSDESKDGSPVLERIANGNHDSSSSKGGSRLHSRHKSLGKESGKGKERHRSTSKNQVLDLMYADDDDDENGGDERNSHSHSRMRNHDEIVSDTIRSESLDRRRERSQSILHDKHLKARHLHESDEGRYGNGKVGYEVDDERNNRSGRYYENDSGEKLRDIVTERGSNYHMSSTCEDKYEDDSWNKGSQEKMYRDKKGVDRESSKERNRDWEKERHSYRSKDHEREKDSIRDRERSRETKGDVDHGRNRNGSRDRDLDRERDRRWEKDRGRSRDRDFDRERRRDDSVSVYRDKDKDWDRSRENGRDKYSDRDRYRDKDRDSVDYRSRRYHKYDERENGYGNRDRRRSYEDAEFDKHSRTKLDPKKHEASKVDLQKKKEDGDRDDDDQNDYQESLELKPIEQEEEDVDRIKEESRRRREAILQKFKAKQSQHKQEQHQPVPMVPKVSDQQLMEQPSQNLASVNSFQEEINDTKNIGKPSLVTDLVGVEVRAVTLGEGSPKSEKSNDMFCDDIFGESPAGVRKTGKGDGLPLERSGLHDNWDDPEGYYSFRFGEILDGRYEITAPHGKGVFSTVVRAKDLKAGTGDPEAVAIKIIRNNETMLKAGTEELIILKKLVGADPEDRRHCVRYLSHFKYRNHLCIVFESLHMNLREVLKKFGRNIGLKLTAVRTYAKQLFIALKHLRNCGVLHCDIKPDNMLVNDSKNVLKLCDFGNAMFAGKNEITPYLVSRFYRAPEIILGLPYDHPMDIWSVGCCLYELYTGKVLFPGPSNNDMLRLHMELKGPFPKKMLRKGAFIEQHFDQDLNFLAVEEDPVTKKAIRRLLVNIKPKDIGNIIRGSAGEDPKMLANFKDLLDKIFVLDPDKRLTVSQALNHPFITGK